MPHHSVEESQLPSRSITGKLRYATAGRQASGMLVALSVVSPQSQEQV